MEVETEQIESKSYAKYMKYSYVGQTGLKVSCMGFGTWSSVDRLSDEKLYELILKAFLAGINFLDTSEMYNDGKTEERVGKALRRGIDDAQWKRSDWVIATKLFKCGSGPNDVGLSRKHVIEGCQESLRRMQLDYVDIVYAHRYDRMTPMKEIVSAFSYLIDRGLAFYWGTSEWPASAVMNAVGIASKCNLVAPVVEQPQYNILHREKVELEFRDLYKADVAGLGITCFSPLHAGILTGKYFSMNSVTFPSDSRLAQPEFAGLRDYFVTNPDGARKLETAANFCALATSFLHSMKLQHGYDPSWDLQPMHVALVWILLNPKVNSILIGPKNLSQLEGYLDSLKLLSAFSPHWIEMLQRELQKIGCFPPSVEVHFGRDDLGDFKLSSRS